MAPKTEKKNAKVGVGTKSSPSKAKSSPEKSKPATMTPPSTPTVGAEIDSGEIAATATSDGVERRGVCASKMLVSQA